MSNSWIVFCKHGSKGIRMRTLSLTLALLGFALLGRAQDHRVSFSQTPGLAAYASGVAMEWKTFDEADVDYYAVLRRSNNMERTVATLEPKGLVDSVTGYRYIDPTVFTPDLAFMLRVVFRDGAYADTEWMSAAKANSTRMRVLSALDEESLARLHITLEATDNQEVVVRVKTLRGQELDTYVRALTTGANTLEIDYSHWPSGYYTVEVDDAQASMEWLVRVNSEAKTASTRRIPKS